MLLRRAKGVRREGGPVYLSPIAGHPCCCFWSKTLSRTLALGVLLVGVTHATLSLGFILAQSRSGPSGGEGVTAHLQQLVLVCSQSGRRCESWCSVRFSVLFSVGP